MKVAAVDIGSNAIRLQVTNIIFYEEEHYFKKLEYVRFPLRLGQDVFGTSEKPPKIQPSTSGKFVKLMQAFKLLIDLYEVDYYMACATSAMREAANGQELVKKVKKDSGLEIRIIDGEEEAEITNYAINSFLEDGIYLHIDVGGGSTELNLYNNKEKVATKSFATGSVRRMGPNDSPIMWKEMQQWVKKTLKNYPGKVTTIGTGGNINKIFDLAGKKPGKAISANKVKSIQDFVASHTFEERINKLHLNADRADVIIPASDIYLAVMHWAQATKIVVPDVGLKDGMIQLMYEKSLTYQG